MAYKLPKQYKWKARQVKADDWSYFKNKKEASKFVGASKYFTNFNLDREDYIKPVRMGT